MSLIHEVIPKILAELGPIDKSQKNLQQNYKFRGIDRIYNEIHSLLAKYEVFTSPEVLKEENEARVTKSGGHMNFTRLWVKYTFYAKDGSSISSVVPGHGMDSGDKASNKAMSAAHKYALIQTFTIRTDDIDEGDATTPEETVPKSVPQKAVKSEADQQTAKEWQRIYAAMKTSQWTEKQMKEYCTQAFKVTSRTQMTSAMRKQLHDDINSLSFREAMEITAQANNEQ